MTKSIQIRNVPEDLHKTLKARAAAAGQSLSDYLLTEVKQVGNRPPIADVLARAAARGGGVNKEAALEVVRYLRRSDDVAQ